MDVTTLPRMTDIGEATPAHRLAADAAELLGYEALDAVGRKERDEALLFEACVACAIRPFRADGVLAYMREKRHEANDYAARAVAPSVTVRPRNAAQRALIATINADRARQLRRLRHAWMRVPLAGYAREIPVGVVAMALALKRHLPPVEFFVDELVEQRQIDPFLVARLGSATFHIAVWNEPGFDVAYE
jgi:hypothetical protein